MPTAEEFLVHPSADEPSELVRGEIRMMTPAGGAHGKVISNLFGLLWNHVRAHHLGECFVDSTGFALPNLTDTVRAPDIAFVGAAKLPLEGIGRAFLALAPDLAVEVLSPTDKPSDLVEKLSDYHAAVVRLIWVIDPERRRVSVIERESAPYWLRVGASLDGGDVVPGFACPVAALFEGLAPQR